MARTNHAYYVRYKMHSADTVHGQDVLAGSKAEAYDKVVYEILPEAPYSAWVSSVTYNNGNYREFNTHEGMPY